MARWKLACSHYINTVKPTKWRYRETDRETGEEVEKEFIVPRLLDISDPKCWTNRYGNRDNPEGEIVVCLPGKGQKGDVEFRGDPTPDMLPLDEEAEAISASFQAHWAYKPDVLEPSYSQSIVDRVDMSTKPVVVEGLAELVAMLAEQTKQHTELMKTFTRRV